ncbi:hypothetical protein GGF48_002484 [Coemansia sp. RSA 921]|nr:hypothetical protein GGF48_002484 [Coemansia sp. RSA 921]
MEDCGETIESRFSKISGPLALSDEISSTCADMANVINKTVSCLTKAAKAGVLHRDISAGNITIRNGQVCVIDWGCGKLTQTDTPKIKDIANEWGFNLGDVTKNENIHDGMTGTPLFMGIRVLFGHPTRSVIDDIESLFYVAMYALSHLSLGPSASPAFNVHENRAAAYVKLGSIISKELYLKIFGVKECSGDVKAQFDLLYQLLFYRDNQFIGGKLTEGKAEARVVDTTIMRKIIGSDLADQIYGSQVDNDMPVGNAPPKRKTRAAKTRKPAPKKPKLAPKKPKPADTNNNQDYTVPQLRPRPGRDTK